MGPLSSLQGTGFPLQQVCRGRWEGREGGVDEKLEEEGEVGEGEEGEKGEKRDKNEKRVEGREEG